MIHSTQDPQVSLKQPFRSMLRYCRPYRKEYLVGAGTGLICLAIDLAVPLIIRTTVNRFDDGTMTYARLWFYFALLLAIALATGVSRYFQRSLIIRASREAEYDLRNDYFRHVQRLSQNFFHRVQTGDIMARAVNDLGYVRMFLGPGIMGTVDLVYVPYTLAVMAYLSPKLTLISLLPLPLLSLIIYSIVMYTHRQSKVAQEQFSILTSRVQENLAGARVVKAYGVADHELRDFERDARQYMRENMKLASVTALTWPFVGFVASLIALIALWWGGRMVIHAGPMTRLIVAHGMLTIGRTPFTLGDLTGFMTCLAMLIFPLVLFGWVLTIYQRGAAGMVRMAEIFTETPAISDSRNVRNNIASIRGGVRFENVCFQYIEDEVLHDISFEISPGQTVAVVGPTGSGKSSVVALLDREYDPTSGRILIDNVDLRELPLRVLRNAIGYVPQDPFLFSETVRENLTFGKPDATQEELDRACEIACFNTTVARLERGYETLLGERGVNLSGGQKQRLAIARALLRNPNILILDDAFSSVDTQTEEQILQRLKPFLAGRACILISHRISTVRDANLIIVLDEGRIVERGTHDDLITQQGLYARMYERQQLEEEWETAP